MADTKENQDMNNEPGSNSNRKDVDKAPGEEVGKYEQVTPEDLKGKKVDADPSSEDGKPIPQDGNKNK